MISILQEIMAGANDRAGFMDAPQIGPANIASRPTTDATAMPAVIPFSFAPELTAMITNMRKNVSMVSSTKDCIWLPAGIVSPSVELCINKSLMNKLANNAPESCEAI